MYTLHVLHYKINISIFKLWENNEFNVFKDKLSKPIYILIRKNTRNLSRLGLATQADRKRAIPKPIKSKMRSERWNFPHLMKKTTYQTVYGFKPINKHMLKITKNSN